MDIVTKANAYIHDEDDIYPVRLEWLPEKGDVIELTSWREFGENGDRAPKMCQVLRIVHFVTDIANLTGVILGTMANHELPEGCMTVGGNHTAHVYVKRIEAELN